MSTATPSANDRAQNNRAENVKPDVLTEHTVLPVIADVSSVSGYACTWFPRVANASSAQGHRGGKLVIYDLAQPDLVMTCYTLDDWHAYKPMLRAHDVNGVTTSQPTASAPKTATGTQTGAAGS